MKIAKGTIKDIYEVTTYWRKVMKAADPEFKESDGDFDYIGWVINQQYSRVIIKMERKKVTGLLIAFITKQVEGTMSLDVTCLNDDSGSVESLLDNAYALGKELGCKKITYSTKSSKLPTEMKGFNNSLYIFSKDLGE